MGNRKVDFDTGIYRLGSYARKYGHANPKSHEIWLSWRIGLWVSHLRKKYRNEQLSPTQITIAKNTGVIFEPPYRPRKADKRPREDQRVDRLLNSLSRLDPFFIDHGHINVGQLSSLNSWPAAGRWIARLRSMYRQGTLPGEVQRKAEALNIDWNPGGGCRKYSVD